MLYVVHVTVAMLRITHPGWQRRCAASGRQESLQDGAGGAKEPYPAHAAAGAEVRAAHPGVLSCGAWPLLYSYPRPCFHCHTHIHTRTHINTSPGVHHSAPAPESEEGCQLRSSAEPRNTHAWAEGQLGAKTDFGEHQATVRGTLRVRGVRARLRLQRQPGAQVSGLIQRGRKCVAMCLIVCVRG